jgi:drug/metabolite transporter (DMT)-like permease
MEFESAQRSFIPVNPALRGIMWMVAAQVLFSAMSVFTRLGTQNVSWQEAAFSRFGIGALVAYVMARMRGARLSITNKKLMWARSSESQ